MRSNRFFLIYLCIVALQVLICNYLNLSYFLTLSLLPVIVIMIPVRYSAIAAMLIAAASGFVVDILGDGVLGLNMLAIVPVALARKGLLNIIFGQEVFAQNEDVTIKKYGIIKFLSFIAMGQALFLIIYILADGAGTRPFWFNALRFGISLVVGILVSLFIADTLTKDYRER